MIYFSMECDEMKFLIGSYAEGVYSANLNMDTKRIESINQLNNLNKPTYLTKTKDGFATYFKRNEMYAIGIFDKNFNMIKQRLFPDAPCHISYSSSQNLFFVSSYHEGTLLVFDKNLNLVQRIAYGTNAKIHFAEYVDDIESLIVVDLGLNSIYRYTINQLHMKLIETIRFAGNPGPRHFTYSKSNKTLYVIHEYECSVTYHAFKDNYFVETHKMFLPRNDRSSASAIRITHDEKFLYLANRGRESLSVINIELKELIQTVDTCGEHPRDFNLSLDEKFVVVANMHSDNLTLFERDSATGKLTLLQKDVYLKKGAAILF